MVQSLIDGARNNVIDNIPVGTNPSGVGINPSTNMIYAANYYDNTVSVIDGSSKTNNTLVRTTLPVGYNPFAVAVNPTTNMVYVTNQHYNSISVLNKMK